MDESTAAVPEDRADHEARIASLEDRIADLDRFHLRIYEAFLDRSPPIVDVEHEPPVMRDLRMQVLRQCTFPGRPAPPTALLIHHTVTGDSTDLFLNIAKGHIRVHDWCSIAYHFGVHKDGSIDWCNDIMSMTPHSGRLEGNAEAVSIALAGWFTPGKDKDPSESQLDGCADLLAWLIQAHPTLDITRIYGHQEYTSTICPGTNWRDWKLVLGQKVREKLEGG